MNKDNKNNISSIPKEEISDAEILNTQALEKLNKKLQEKQEQYKKIEKLPGLYVLKKSRFYDTENGWREHIATYKDYAIMLKTNNLRGEQNNNTTQMYPILVPINGVKYMKKVNGNIVRKKNPDTLSWPEKMVLIEAVTRKIDNEL